MISQIKKGKLFKISRVKLYRHSEGAGNNRLMG